MKGRPMGIFDRITAKAGAYDDYEYDETYDDAVEGDDYYEDEAEVAPVRSLPPVADVARIVTVWVSSYAEVRDFAVEFRSGLPVILNLSKAGDDERKRIVDFAVGLTFGLEGAIDRISDDVFLLTPASVKIDSLGAQSTHAF